MLQISLPTRLALFTLLQVLTCQHAQASRKVISHRLEGSAVLEELKKLGVSVYDDHLVTADGRTYPKITWGSPFEKDLALKLHDPVKVQAIVQSYKLHLDEALDGKNDVASRFKAWLLEHCFFLGSQTHSGGEELRTHTELYTEVLAALGDDASALEAFFDDLREADAENVRGDQAEARQITLITTSGGGGHFTVAAAMQELLQQKTPYTVKLIDYGKLQFSCDALWLATGRYTGDIIYNQIFQQEHNNEKTNLYWNMYHVLEDYIPYTCHRVLKDKIKEQGSQLLISTMPHEDRHVDLAYSLDTPLRVVATDYQLAFSQYANVLHARPQLVRYWLPDEDHEILEGLARLRGDAPPMEQRRQRVAALLRGELPFAGLHAAEPVFEVLGFPVRLSFKQAQHTSSEEEVKLKAALGIAAGEEVVILSMGRQGVGVLLDLVKELQESRQDWQKPLHIVVVCGKNEAMQTAIAEYVAATSELGQRLHFVVLGQVNEQNMARYFRIADSLISKPGGATTAEASAMKLPVLICHAHEWEQCNKSYLLRHGLGRELNLTQPLAVQLRALLGERLKDRSTYQAVAWQDKLLGFVAEIFNEARPKREL